MTGSDIQGQDQSAPSHTIRNERKPSSHPYKTPTDSASPESSIFPLLCSRLPVLTRPNTLRAHVKAFLTSRLSSCGTANKLFYKYHREEGEGRNCRCCWKFECELCDRSFSEKWALNNHMKLHNGEKPYKCIWPSCHYAFLNLSAMKDHYRTHTVGRGPSFDLPSILGAGQLTRLPPPPPTALLAPMEVNTMQSWENTS
ncbi:hypothetical protein CRENBAI_006719 [Crenichthys baileyi]|uniref:C2H2-type domain-containing protein n=1 Tax=Crenichthys baileyi TaxID=28760 RepID=A0AAV9S191_9TELE